LDGNYALTTARSRIAKAERNEYRRNVADTQADSLPVLKPPALEPGAHLRLLSLSAPIAALCPRRFERGCAYLRELGFRVSTAPTTTQRLEHMAGSPEDRARDFVEAWLDPEVHGILSVIGGHNTHQILEHLPFERMLQPKALIGYSDTTTLMVALFAHHRLVSFHGPALLPQFGEFGGMAPRALDSFLAAVRNPDASRRLPAPGETVTEHLRWDKEDDRPRQRMAEAPRRCLRSGVARGRLIVANMGCLLLLAGTRYFPDVRGALLVLEEDEDESPETIDRFVTHLRHLGVWAEISGLALGRFPKQVGLSEQVLNDMLLRATRGHDFPIMTGLEVGHVDPALTIPMGVMAELDATRCQLTLLERATSTR
jgi:muramoyltetrapeptide carboxypeptidase